MLTKFGSLSTNFAVLAAVPSKILLKEWNDMREFSPLWTRTGLNFHEAFL